jgi:hypothetical protein
MSCLDPSIGALASRKRVHKLQCVFYQFAGGRDRFSPRQLNLLHYGDATRRVVHLTQHSLPLYKLDSKSTLVNESSSSKSKMSIQHVHNDRTAREQCSNASLNGSI